MTRRSLPFFLVTAAIIGTIAATLHYWFIDQIGVSFGWFILSIGLLRLQWAVYKYLVRD